MMRYWSLRSECIFRMVIVPRSFKAIILCFTLLSMLLLSPGGPRVHLLIIRGYCRLVIFRCGWLESVRQHSLVYFLWLISYREPLISTIGCHCYCSTEGALCRADLALRLSQACTHSRGGLLWGYCFVHGSSGRSLALLIAAILPSFAPSGNNFSQKIWLRALGDGKPARLLWGENKENSFPFLLCGPELGLMKADLLLCLDDLLIYQTHRLLLNLLGQLHGHLETAHVH